MSFTPRVTHNVFHHICEEKLKIKENSWHHVTAPRYSFCAVTAVSAFRSIVTFFNHIPQTRTMFRTEFEWSYSQILPKRFKQIYEKCILKNALTYIQSIKLIQFHNAYINFAFKNWPLSFNSRIFIFTFVTSLVWTNVPILTFAIFKTKLYLP